MACGIQWLHHHRRDRDTGHSGNSDLAGNSCDHKYDNESGTMYRSFSAFCRAEVAQRYSRQARKTSRPSR